MTLGLRRRWYCTNVTGCARARADTPYWKEDIDPEHAVCHEPGCGSALVEGRPLNLWPRGLGMGAATLAVLVLIGWAARLVFFPPPLDNVAFAQSETRVQERAGALSLIVARSAHLQERQTVKFRASNGTAKAGTNFEAVEGELVFEPGDTSKALNVTLLPGSGYLKNDVYFQVTLTNVEGHPRQTVVIEEPKVASTQADDAKHAVRAASVIAKDVADQVVRESVASRMVATQRSDPARFDFYQRQLATIQGNLRRSRESYAQSLRDLRGMQPRAVMQAMDDVAEDLARNGFSQQSKAVVIMKRQYGEFLAKGNIDMDRWADELGTVVPKGPAPPASSL